jgi:hypothetical protein
MNIDVRTLIDLASAAHDFHKAHHRIDVAVAQRTDALGIHLHVDLQAAIPEGALIFGRVSGAWLGKLSAADDVLFRDADGHFVTLGPIVGQRGALYIPYGAARNRGPGLYTLEMSIRLVCSDPANPTELAHASYKLALPEQRPWRRMEFFAPLVTLCMAVIRVDNEVLTAEVRGLKALLGDSVTLSGQDLADLRDLMKAPVPTDLDRAAREPRPPHADAHPRVHPRAPRRRRPPRRPRQRPRARRPDPHRRPPRRPAPAPHRPALRPHGPPARPHDPRRAMNRPPLAGSAGSPQPQLTSAGPRPA